MTGSIPTQIEWKRVKRSHPCAICRKTDWCSFSGDGAWAICRRVSGASGHYKTDATGVDYWVHCVDPSIRRSAPDLGAAASPSAERADDATLDAVYRVLISALSLSDEHREQLRRRGLTDAQIGEGMYRSLPLKGRKAFAGAVLASFSEGVCARIPGLFVKRDNDRSWWSVAGSPGLVIPCQSAGGMICALKVRSDSDDADHDRYTYISSASHDGPSPGAPPHVSSFGTWPSTRARLTEGELKADVCAALTGTATMSIPGVSHWRKALLVLKASGVKEVVLAFDADAETNPFVARELKAVAQTLRSEGFAITLETWASSDAKGLDDLLAAGKKPALIVGDLALARINEIEEFSTASEKPIQERVNLLKRHEGEPWPELLDRLTSGGVLTAIAGAPGLIRHCIATAKARLGLNDDEEKDLRAAIESAGRAAREQSAEELDGEPGKAERLIAIGVKADLFCDETREAFGAIDRDGHREVHALRSEEFKEWLVQKFFEENGQACGDTSVNSALLFLSAKARTQPPREVHVRVCREQGECWFDLADRDWRAIRITRDGWTIVERPAVLFRRFPNTRPQVDPAREGTLEELRKFFHLRSDRDWHLLVAWLVAGLMPGSPRPALALTGEQGSAKSTTTRMLRKLVDPAKAQTVRIPKDVAQLAQILAHGWLIAFDNLSFITDEISDVLCGAVTGDGYLKRALYTDEGDKIWEYRRLLILNGIANFIEKADFLDRTLIIRLDRFLKDERKEEEDLWREFEAARPRIFGALLDTVSACLRILDRVSPPSGFRMADFCRIGCAVEVVLGWPRGSFASAMRTNAADQVEEALEAAPLAQEVRSFMEQREKWEGTASKLLVELNAKVDQDVKRSRAWPPDATRLSRALGQIAPILRALGLDIERGDREGRDGTRILRLTKLWPDESNRSTHGADELNGMNEVVL
jgi:Domain of unknown function (DUF3854)